MRLKDTIHAVDLFAGGGGTSTGLARACRAIGKKIELTAINHWEKAIETHAANHPWATHLCIDVQFADPRVIVPDRHLNILVASPSCVHFSRAAGGRPKNDQQRASVWDILRWLEYIDVESMLVENVPELMSYGPLDKKGFPIKDRKGETYRAWIDAIKSFGYNVEARLINAADFGAATSRTRLFIVARRGKKEIRWPEPTHSRSPNEGKERWRPAREIIDWSIKGESIFNRKKPLSPNTIRRIIAGLKKFGGAELQPFLVLMEHGGGIKGLDSPLPTITTAKGGSMALVEPFVLSQASGGAPRSTEEPLPTIISGGNHALIQPFIVEYHGDKGCTNKRVSSIGDPLPTIDTSNRYAIAEPFILPNEGFYRGNTAKSVEEPLGTITQRGAGGLAQAVIVQYNGASGPQSVDEPLPTISTRDRFGLVQPVVVNGWRLDILFRMLQPQELAAAMGFPRGYEFKGTRKDITKLIGNAVVVEVAEALCHALLE